MRNSLNRYYLDKTLKRDDDEKWLILLDIAMLKADSVMFNVLKKDYTKDNEISSISEDLVEKAKGIEKFYQSGYCLRYHLTEKVKKFIKLKKVCRLVQLLLRRYFFFI